MYACGYRVFEEDTDAGADGLGAFTSMGDDEEIDSDLEYSDGDLDLPDDDMGDEEEDALIPIQEAFASDDGIQNLLLTLATSDVFRHLWTGESP